MLGVLPGIVGTIQANEAIKLIIGKGEPLIGRLLLFDALKMRFREFRVRKSAECPVCGTNPTITGLIDYEEFCGVQPRAETPASESEMTVLDLRARLDRGDPPFLLDVREPHEYQLCHLPGTELIPLREIPSRWRDLDPARETVVYCRTGQRSERAAAFLKDHGFRRVLNLRGGIDAWARDVDPTMPRY